MEEVEDTSHGGWTKVIVIVDSGAADHVGPPGFIPKVQIVESEGSRTGRRYVAANGSKVPNLGEKAVKMMTDEYLQVKVTWQMADVKKPLLSVHKLIAGGQVVILDKRCPRIISPGGWVTKLRSRNGLFELDLWVKDEDEKKVGFHRQ